MFGKLLKYDFRSMWKQFAFIWPAALALALVNHFTLSGLESTSAVGETTAGIAMLVYVAILMAMFIAALIFVIQRFYKGLLGDEGYLMHTLPVRPWQLIGSKLLCAVATTFLSVVVALLSICLLFPWNWELAVELFQGLGYIFSHWNVQATHSVTGILEFCLMLLASFAVGYLQLYLSMSVGHLFSKNRVAMSVIAFIAINAVMSALMNTFGPGLEPVLKSIVENRDAAASFHINMWAVIVWDLALSAIYFAGTEYILRRKLNLE
ncbi:MAG: hypothetical protein K2P20_05900 [Oscillospiraceae bacterium]|nr:hypothetical protein [Oscillospiraceae bacterium]